MHIHIPENEAHEKIIHYHSEDWTTKVSSIDIKTIWADENWNTRIIKGKAYNDCSDKLKNKLIESYGHAELQVGFFLDEIEKNLAKHVKKEKESEK